jgi:hypothetical protein
MAGTKRPADFTGITGERLAAQHAKEVALKAKEMSMLNQVAADEDAADVDYSEVHTPVFETDADGEFTAIEIKPKNKKIRVNSELEDVTVGHGNHYSFHPGPWYTVPENVAAHLEEKGYVYH